MPFFNFRRGGASSAPNAGAAQPASAEVLRKRAKHRLIGAAVLVLIGVVGFPLLFDTQPRPVAVDIPIVIPGKGTVAPLPAPSAVATAPAAVTPTPAPVPSKPVVAAAPAVSEKVTAANSLAPEEEIVPSKPAPETHAEAKPVKPEPKPVAKVEPKPEPKPQVAALDDAARARALLNGQTLTPVTVAKAATAATADARLIVQVGAFADSAKAQEARAKLERAGLKTYAQVADTKDGKRTRVRVGPFATRAEAEKAATKIKSLDLPAAILTL